MEPKTAGFQAKGIVVNGEPDDIAWARYRAGAILRDVEQRAAEGLPLRDDHAKIMAERDMLLARIRHHETA